MQHSRDAKVTIPPLNGLVLAGGRSKRMGRDKGLLDWHGKAQRYYLADLLTAYCKQVYISCRADQVNDITTAGYLALPDSAIPDAQFGAIVSAMAAEPANAWLVVACDLPFIDNVAFDYIVHQRDAYKLATAYLSPENGLPEPLCAIWEPQAKAMLLEQYAKGIDCPRKALLHNAGQAKFVDSPKKEYLMNVNTPEAAAEARQLITGYVSR